MNWLFKEEPTNYSFDDFARDGGTTWSGVKNPLAQKHLRSVRKGDRIFYYHTGNQKAVIGIARAVSNAYLDPDDNAGKRHVVDVAPVRKLRRPVTLAEIKGGRSPVDARRAFWAGRRERSDRSPGQHAPRSCAAGGHVATLSRCCSDAARSQC